MLLSQHVLFYRFSVIKCSPKKRRVLNGKCKLDERKIQFKFEASEKIALFDIRKELPGS